MSPRLPAPAARPAERSRGEPACGAAAPSPTRRQEPARRPRCPRRAGALFRPEAGTALAQRPPHGTGGHPESPAGKVEQPPGQPLRLPPARRRRLSAAGFTLLMLCRVISKNDITCQGRLLCSFTITAQLF